MENKRSAHGLTERKIPGVSPTVIDLSTRRPLSGSPQRATYICFVGFVQRVGDVIFYNRKVQSKWDPEMVAPLIDRVMGGN
jgi:hypothetical protein